MGCVQSSSAAAPEQPGGAKASAQQALSAMQNTSPTQNATLLTSKPQWKSQELKGAAEPVKTSAAGEVDEIALAAAQQHLPAAASSMEGHVDSAPVAASATSGQAQDVAAQHIDKAEVEQLSMGQATELQAKTAEEGFVARILDVWDGSEVRALGNHLEGLFDSVHLVSLSEALAPIRDDLRDDLVESSMATARKLHNQYGKLTLDMLGALAAYSAEVPAKGQSVYTRCNMSLRSGNRGEVEEWVNYIWLLLNAMRLLPVAEELHLYRGVKKGIKEFGPNYQDGNTFVDYAFQSCTTDIKVVENFIGDAGSRTIFAVKLNRGGRSIRDFSFFQEENEILLPPGLKFFVRSSYTDASGLTIVQVEQVDPGEQIMPINKEVLTSPFIVSSAVGWLYRVTEDNKWGDHWSTGWQLGLMCTDGAGGLFITTSSSIRHVTEGNRSGEVWSSGWKVPGHMCTDGAGGVFVTSTSTLYHVTEGNRNGDGWSSGWRPGQMCPDGAGGVFITSWSTLRHVTAGSRSGDSWSSGWNPTAMCPDGKGGVFIMSNTTLRHVTEGNKSGEVWSSNWWANAMCEDGNGGVFVISNGKLRHATESHKDGWVWKSNLSPENLQMCSDGTGGVIILDGGNLFRMTEPEGNENPLWSDGWKAQPQGLCPGSIVQWR